MNLPEYPGIGFKDSDVNENKTSRTDLTRALIHNNPYLCLCRSLGGWLLSRFTRKRGGTCFPI